MNWDAIRFACVGASGLKPNHDANPIPAERLAGFYNAVMELPAMGRDYILLLLFTGLRRKEAAGLRWSEVDFERRIICLPVRG